MSNLLDRSEVDAASFSPLTALAMALGVLVAVCILYARSFGTLPTADDFGILSPLIATYPDQHYTLRDCFTTIHPSRYRPLEQVTGWLSCDAGRHFSTVRFRIIAMLGMAIALTAFASWCRLLKVPARFAIAGLLLYAFHPIHAGTLGAMDTSSTSFIYGIGFGTAALAYRFPRAWVVAIATFGGTLLASCFKEYGYGVPLLVMAAVWARRGRPSWPLLVWAAIGGGIAVLFHRGLHHAMMPPGLATEVPAVHLSPKFLVLNIVLYAGAAVMAGYSPGIFLDHSPLHIVLGLFIACVIGTLIVVALWAALFRLRTRGMTAFTDQTSGPGHAALVAILLVPGASLPNLVVMRASEVYIPGTVFCVGLLAMAGLWGLARRWPRMQPFAFVALALALPAMAYSTWLKVADIRSAGDDAHRIARGIREALPLELTSDAVVGVVVDHRRPQYSIFRMDGAAAIGVLPTSPCVLTALPWYGLSPRITLVQRYREPFPPAAADESNSSATPATKLVPGFIVAIDDRTRTVTRLDPQPPTYPGNRAD